MHFYLHRECLIYVMYLKPLVGIDFAACPVQLVCVWGVEIINRTRTRTNTNPNDTEANAAGRSGNARALRKQSKCGVNHEGEGYWPKFPQNLQKARHLWVARTPQKQ